MGLEQRYVPVGTDVQGSGGAATQLVVGTGHDIDQGRQAFGIPAHLVGDALGLGARVLVGDHVQQGFVHAVFFTS
ncbi:MAG: hypothetical protein OHK0039_29490 [Bacteroidia bacterium]